MVESLVTLVAFKEGQGPLSHLHLFIEEVEFKSELGMVLKNLVMSASHLISSNLLKLFILQML
jgi:hypothetical protein